MNFRLEYYEINLCFVLKFALPFFERVFEIIGGSKKSTIKHTIAYDHLVYAGVSLDKTLIK